MEFGTFIGIELGINFGIQIIMWAVSSIIKTEKLYDFTGMFTYLSVVACPLVISALNSEKITYLDILLAILVSIWTIRLGVFLFIRAKNFGDSRFTEVIKKPLIYLIYWSIQGVWVFLTSLPAIATIFWYSDDTEVKALDYALCIIGTLMWVVGFLLEAISDQQKYKFKALEDNRGKFINVGIWSKLKYPNYYGEIILWWGVYVVCCSKLQNWQFLLALCPIYVMIQLIFVSGIRIQKRQAFERWGTDEDYQQYLKQVWF